MSGAIPLQAVALLGGFALICLAYAVLRRARKAARRFAGRALLTVNEHEFYGRLRAALPQYTILLQVAMSALIRPCVDEQHPQFWTVRRAFAQKYVDFVVCHPASLEVVAIVELDDQSHDPDKDALRDAMLGEAGYAVIRWDSANRPAVADIAEVFFELAQARSGASG